MQYGPGVGNTVSHEGLGIAPVAPFLPNCRELYAREIFVQLIQI